MLTESFAQHPEPTRTLEKPAGESFLVGYPTSPRHENRISEFPSARKRRSKRIGPEVFSGPLGQFAISSSFGCQLESNVLSMSLRYS